MTDLVEVREGGTVAEALAISLRTARHVETLGFKRYLLAEHHNMAGIASSATAVLVGHIAGGTRQVRFIALGAVPVADLRHSADSSPVDSLTMA